MLSTAFKTHSPRPIASAALAVALLLAALPQTQAADTASPLREYLEQKKQAIATLQKQDVAPSKLHVRVIAEGRSGVRRLRIGDKEQFQWISDSPREGAGFNLGPGSWPSLVGTLSSAVADEYVVQAAAKDIPLDALDVVFTSIPERKSAILSYPNNLSYTVYISSPASDARLEELKAAVHASSSVIDLVTQPHRVSPLTIEYTHSPVQREPNTQPGLRDFIT